MPRFWNLSLEPFDGQMSLEAIQRVGKVCTDGTKRVCGERERESEIHNITFQRGAGS